MTDKLHRIDPKTTLRARELRRRSTVPEKLLWARLRAGRINGKRFRRQHALGPYVVDFYCPEVALAVEIDGRSHYERAEHDERRTRHLESLGVRLIRFTNDAVITSADAIAETIAAEVERMSKHAGSDVRR